MIEAETFYFCLKAGLKTWNILKNIFSIRQNWNSDARVKKKMRSSISAYFF